MNKRLYYIVRWDFRFNDGRVEPAITYYLNNQGANHFIAEGVKNSHITGHTNFTLEVVELYECELTATLKDKVNTIRLGVDRVLPF
jgi:hypothetical protein